MCPGLRLAPSFRVTIGTSAEQHYQVHSILSGIKDLMISCAITWKPTPFTEISKLFAWPWNVISIVFVIQLHNTKAFQRVFECQYSMGGFNVVPQLFFDYARSSIFIDLTLQGDSLSDFGFLNCIQFSGEMEPIETSNLVWCKPKSFIINQSFLMAIHCMGDFSVITQPVASQYYSRCLGKP